MKYLILLTTLLLASCDNSPSQPGTSSTSNSSGIMEHMAASAVGGMAAGAGAAVGHAAINHGINKWRTHSRLRRMRR